MTATDETGLLAAARAGDEQAFVHLTAPHRRALYVHCYRMLGSLADADDAVQETMLRAWRGLGGFEPRAPLSAWLYRIATNVCLRMGDQRTRRAAVIDSYLQPYPDRLLEELPSPQRGPEAEAEARESIGLAFVTAMQLLPPRQRAVLVLRDVLGWSALEVAELLDDSVAAVNSVLQRARQGLRRAGDEAIPARAHAPLDPRAEADLMRRFVDAWEAVDIDGIVALLADDAVLTMPPEPMRIVGPDGIGEFFATVPMEGRLELIRLVPARSNGQPALAAYVEDPADGVYRAYGLMVFAHAGGEIGGITGFAGYPELYPAFGLAPELDR